MWNNRCYVQNGQDEPRTVCYSVQGLLSALKPPLLSVKESFISVLKMCSLQYACDRHVESMQHTILKKIQNKAFDLNEKQIQ